MKRVFDRVPRVLIEPGRALVGNAGVTAYRVGTVKEIPGARTYVAVDGGMSDNLRPMLYGSRYEALIANRADAAPETAANAATSEAARVVASAEASSVPVSARVAYTRRSAPL